MNKPKLTPEQRQQIKLYKSILQRLGNCYTDMLGLNKYMAEDILGIMQRIDTGITRIEKGQQCAEPNLNMATAATSDLDTSSTVLCSLYGETA
jgi:hypothetical protein